TAGLGTVLAVPTRRSSDLRWPLGRVLSSRSLQTGEQGMRVGIPLEARAGERLVAATPTSVAQLTKLGYDVVVQEGAGAAASFADLAYQEAGASIVPADEVWT